MHLSTSLIITSRSTISIYITILAEMPVSRITLRLTRFNPYSLFTRNINMCDILPLPLQCLRRNAPCLLLATLALCRWSSASSFLISITAYTYYTYAPPRRPRIANVPLLLP